jgi:hypothetical protein
MKEKFEGIVRELSVSPSRHNWERFRMELRSSRARYYRIIFGEGKIARQQDLKSSYAELYDEKESPLGKVPIFIEEGEGISGATEYLKGLLNINK